MKKRLLSQKQRDSLKTVKESFLNGLTSTQIENYIDSTVIDLASAKIVLKKLAKVLLMVCKHINLQ